MRFIRTFFLFILLCVFQSNVQTQTNNMLADLFSAGYAGGAGDDLGHAMAIDQLGNVYVMGITNSATFPTTAGAFDSTFNGGTYDIFVAKYNYSLSSLVAATFIGGSGADIGHEMVIGNDGNLYISGTTQSNDFPLTPGTYKDSLTGANEVFLIKLSNDLSTVLQSTLVSHSVQDVLYGSSHLGLSPDGSVFVTANIEDSLGLPFPNAFDPTYNGQADAMLFKLNSTFDTLLAATFLGDSLDDYVMGIAVNQAGQVFVAGRTNSKQFPVTSGVLADTLTGLTDLFISRFDNQLQALEASTYFGGTGFDLPLVIKLDNNQNPVIGGRTSSADWPLATMAHRYTLAGTTDGFVMRIHPDLNNLQASTYIGGSSIDQVSDMAIDNNNQVYLAGYSLSADFPIDTLNAIDTSFSTGIPEGFLSKLNEGLWILAESTWFGGSDADQVTAVSVNPTGDLYFTGWTNSDDLPVTPNAIDTLYNGASDVFITKAQLTATQVEEPVLDRFANTCKVYGNTLEFNIAEPADLSVAIYSIDGKMIENRNFGQHNAGIYHYLLPALTPGIYVLSIHINEQWIGEKLGVF